MFPLTANDFDTHGLMFVANDNNVSSECRNVTNRSDDASASPAILKRSATRSQAIHISELRKDFGNRTVLQDVDFNIEPGEFVAIVGKSGCGKSTLLRLLAQLDAPSSGRIDFGVNAVDAKDATRIMFQDPRLLPWKSVLDNVCLGLNRSQRDHAKSILQRVGLGDRLNDWPLTLSGGQRQRVALARALVHSPHLLILDEPLGALDALTRLEMQRLIESLWKELGFTAILVTHDVTEAVALGDRVILLEDGGVALDLPVNLSRPRQQGDARFAHKERILLDHLLKDRSADSATVHNTYNKDSLHDTRSEPA